MVFQEDVIPLLHKFINSRVLLVGAVAGLLAVTLTSCGLALNEGNGNPNGNMKLNDGGAGCIEKSLPKIEKYFKGEATVQETNESWSCLSVALEMFYTKVKGQNPNSYTPKELKTFLEGFFLGNIKLTDEFMDEAFKLKKVILGGDGASLTRDEIVRLMDDLRLLQNESVRLLPHLAVVLKNAQPNTPAATNDKVQAAKIALNEMTDVIATVFAHAEAVYPEESARAFLTEVQKVFDQTESKWQGPTVAIGYLPTFFVAKSFLLDGTDKVVYPGEWSRIVKMASRLYGVYLQVEYLVRPAADMLHGVGLEYFNQLLSEGFGILETAINNKASGSIPFETIDKVVEQIYFLKLIDSDFMQDNTLKGLARTIVGKLYHPMVDGIRPIASGLDKVALELMRKDAYGFYEMQSQYDKISADSLVAGQDLTYKTFADAWPTRGARADHLEQIRKLIKPDFPAKPMMWDDNLNIVYDDSGFAEKVTPKKFTELNWRRMMIYVLARGYANTGENVEVSGLMPTPDFQALYWDFRMLAHELQFLDKNDDKIWESTAEESQIFFLYSDGKKPVSTTEGFGFLGLALQAGKVSTPIYNEMKKVCPVTGFHDNFGAPLIDAECSKKVVYNDFKDNFETLPRWYDVYSKLKDEDLTRFKENVFYITTKCRNHVERGVQSGDVAKIASVFQYGESIFWRFDANGDGKLNLPESMKAWPIFHDYLAEAAKGDVSSEGDLEALYTYLLRYKRVPSTIFQKAEFLWWKMNKSTWKYEDDRADMIDIIATMKKQSAKSNTDPEKSCTAEPLVRDEDL